MDLMRELGIDGLVLTEGDDDRVSDANPAALALWGQPLEALRGRPLDTLCVAEDRRWLDELRRTSSGSSHLRRVTARLSRQDGQPTLVSLRLRQQRAADATPRCLWTLTLLDLRDSRHPLHLTMFDALNECVLVLDEDLRLIAANAAAAEMLGAPEAVLLGRHVYALGWLPLRDDGSKQPLEESPFGLALHRREPQGPLRMHLRASDGDERWSTLRAVPVDFSIPGLRRGVIVTSNDITEQLRAEASLRQSERQARNAEAEVRRLNLALEERVAERTAALQAKTRELESFTYSVSHDLKAPLRGIDGYSRLLLSEHANRLDEEGQGFVRTIRRATQQMGELIDDLLAYAKVDRRELRLSALNLRQVVDEALAERRVDLAAPGLRLAHAVADCQVWAEREALLLVLRNLLDNALKFSAGVAERRIEIGAHVEGARCRLWVCDNGVGFDMRYHDRLFEIFQRLQRAEDFPGTGVGLAIVRKAVERQHGQVWAEGAPGQGATFFVSLPLPPTLSPPA